MAPCFAGDRPGWANRPSRDVGGMALPIPAEATEGLGRCIRLSGLGLEVRPFPRANSAPGGCR
ncbi:MAG: hypothetical protein WKF43_07875 [Acidimicrobiales bacterium]